jgi:hypothetical protein
MSAVSMLKRLRLSLWAGVRILKTEASKQHEEILDQPSICIKGLA